MAGAGLILEVSEEAAGQRLDRWLTEQLPDVSRSHLQTLIEQGRVNVDGRACRSNTRLQARQRVEVSDAPTTAPDIPAEPLPLTVVYEDKDVLVVDKPAGLVVHPAPGHPSGTLVNALLARWGSFKGLEGSFRPGIVHRLDKDTSGLLIVAKSDAAMLKLSAQIKDRRVHKEYLALVVGQLQPAEGRVEAPVGRHPGDRQRMAVIRGGREATTHYKVEGSFTGYSLVLARPVTGRTHQIRVHLAFTGHPVAGDRLYGQSPPLGLDRQFLHASRLGFRLPSSGEWIELESPLPPDLAGFLTRLSPL